MLVQQFHGAAENNFSPGIDCRDIDDLDVGELAFDILDSTFEKSLLILCGMVLIVLGMGKMIVSLLTLFLPRGERELINILYQKRYLERGPKIVAIGGGTGLSHLLFGLKEYTANITAIVTVADSGGSSGRLREEFNIVAPGDIRNCLVALADAPALMGELFHSS